MYVSHADTPVSAPLDFIKTQNTPGDKVEVHRATGTTGFAVKDIASATRFNNFDRDNGVWQLVGKDLYFIKTKNTPTGKVEVYSATAASAFQSGVGAASIFTSADSANGTFQMVDSTLYFIKTKNTGSGKVEVYAASAASNYASLTVQIATGLGTGDADNGLWRIVNNHDLALLKTANTANTKVELYTVTSASNYQTFGIQSATAFNTSDTANGSFALADTNNDGTPDVCYIKTKNTSSATVEVYCAQGTTYGSVSFSTKTVFPLAEGTNGTWHMGEPIVTPTATPAPAASSTTPVSTPAASSTAPTSSAANKVVAYSGHNDGCGSNATHYNGNTHVAQTNYGDGSVCRCNNGTTAAYGTVYSDSQKNPGCTASSSTNPAAATATTAGLPVCNGGEKFGKCKDPSTNNCGSNGQWKFTGAGATRPSSTGCGCINGYTGTTCNVPLNDNCSQSGSNGAAKCGSTPSKSATSPAAAASAAAAKANGAACKLEGGIYVAASDTCQGKSGSVTSVRGDVLCSTHGNNPTIYHDITNATYYCVFGYVVHDGSDGTALRGYTYSSRYTCHGGPKPINGKPDCYIAN